MTTTPWLVVYHKEPDIEYEEDNMPSQRNLSIKFIHRYDKCYVQSADGTGWILVTDQQAESQLPYTPRNYLEAAVAKAYLR